MMKSNFSHIPVNIYVVLGIGLYLMFSCEQTGASSNLVGDKDSFKESVQAAQPGNVSTLANGVWTDTELMFMADGSEIESITLTTEEKGKVIFEGQSNLRLAGHWPVVEANQASKPGDLFALKPRAHQPTESISVLQPIPVKGLDATQKSQITYEKNSLFFIRNGPSPSLQDFSLSGSSENKRPLFSGRHNGRLGHKHLT